MSDRRPVALTAESYEAIRDAMNTHEIDEVDFGRVSDALPSFMSPSDIVELRAQYENELHTRNPDWDDSIKKERSRLVFTIGRAACCEAQDVTTAKSAERVLWQQKSVLSWGFAIMLRKDRHRYVPR